MVEIPIIIGSVFQKSMDPYRFQSLQSSSFPIILSSPDPLPSANIGQAPVDIFNRYYLEIGNPNPLSGVV